MASLASWLSAGVMQALGWTLVHALWQCLGVAAVSAALMALSRRPSLRYAIAVGALALMLAAPVVTLLVLVASNAQVAVLVPASSSIAVPSVPAVGNTAVTPAPVTANNRLEAFKSISRRVPAPAGLPLQSFLPWLVAAWLCGVTLFSLRFAGGFLLLEHRRRSKSGVLDPHILALCHAVQQQMSLSRAIGYLQCNWLDAPAVMGWIRPIVLLPVTVLTGLSEDQLRAVIAHELAHIRRLDSTVNLFQILVETLLFYHPAVWWLNRRIRAERELCCDEIVVSLTGNRLEYARALAHMAECKNVTVLAMAANRGPLAQRVLHVLGAKPSGAGQRMVGLAGGLLFLLAALAAANLLFGIAEPPMAQARENIKIALSSIQDATGHLARQALQMSQPATPQAAAPDQTEAANSSAEPLVPPSPDLSRMPPVEAPAIPKLVASNDVRTANDQPAAPDRSDPLVASAAGAANASGPRTEAGIRCLLGLEPDGCWRGFENSYARQDITHCPGDWGADGTDSRCPWGTLKSIEYLGTNAAGDDVYSVSFLHSNITYVLPQPGPDRRIATRCIFYSSPAGASRGVCLGYHSAAASTATVTSPANPPRILYTRAAEQTGSSAANASGPRTKLALACILATSKDCEKIYLAARNARPRGYYPSLQPEFVTSTQFAGRNDVGDEVWDVKLKHVEHTYIISPPDPDGRVQRFLIRGGPPDRQCDNLVEQLLPVESHLYVSCHILQQEIAQPATTAGATVSASDSVTAAKPEIVPGTPSGAGDPNAMVCRAPQRVPGSDQLGPQVCLQNSEWWKVAMNGKDIAADGKTLIARPMVGYPRGEGDPDDVTCRKPQILDSGKTIAQYGPEICRTNRFWADIIKNLQVVDANGEIVKRPLGTIFGVPPGGLLHANGPGIPPPYTNAGPNFSGNPSQSAATP